MTSKPKRLVKWVAAVLAPIALAIIGVEIYGMTPLAREKCNASTMASDWPSIPPHTYDMPPEQTLQVAAAVIARLPGWSIDKRDQTKGIVKATVAHGLGILTDDVWVEVRPKGRNASVDVSSTSRIEDGVLGANAGNIRALQAAMDERLPPAS